MSETYENEPDTHPEGGGTGENDDIVMDKETMSCFLKFKAQQEQKKDRAEKKRLTKKGLPDKRAESSSKNVSKAREKVKEYLALSKAVVDDGDTDEEYIEVCVKKNPKKNKKYMSTVVVPQPDPPPVEPPQQVRVHKLPLTSEIIPPPKIQPPRIEDSAVYKLMFGDPSKNPIDLRNQLLNRHRKN